MISVRAEPRFGKRLNPRRADLQRWRETFAEKLRGRGIEAEATRQATRGVMRNHPDLWRPKAAQEGRLLKLRPVRHAGASVPGSKAKVAGAGGARPRFVNGKRVMSIAERRKQS